MVELVNGSKGVVVITSSIEDAKQNCVSVFKRIINCVMEAKEDFCHSIKPQFFLFDPSQSADAIEANFPNNVERRRMELVDTWISSSSSDPHAGSNSYEH